MTSKPLLAGLALLISTGLVRAQSIVFVGSLENDPSAEIRNWSSAGTSKTLDLDGNNLYGSDGYVWMNASNSSAGAGPLASLVESVPSYFTGSIAYTGSGGGGSSSFGGADDVRNPTNTADQNVGYAGYAGANGTLQEAFAFTLGRDMGPSETIRVGVVLDSLADTQIGCNGLRIVAGGVQADATLVTGSRTGAVDMYFFDVTDLSNGDEIQIWLSKEATGGLNWATMGGVLFDSTGTPQLPSVASNDFATTDQLLSIDIDVLVNDSSTGAVTALQVVSGPGFGTAVPQGTASILYTHTTGTPASDSFVYRFNDDNGWSDTATVTVTLAAPPAPIAAGTVIGIDFGPTAPAPATNFNQYSSATSSSLSTIIDTAGNEVDGVGLTVVNASSAWSNNDAATEANLPGQPTVFDDTHLTDWIGKNTNEPDHVLTFTGLDDSLVYDVLVGSSFVAGGTNTDTDWAAGAQSGTSVHDSGPNAFVSFTALATDGSGNLVISSTDAGAANITVVSALLLTAKAAPSSLAANDFATTDLLLSVDIDVLVNDFSTGAVTALQVVSGPGFGTAVPQGTTSILYTHTTGTPPSDSFVYRFNDDNGWSNTATVTITLTVPPVPLVLGTKIGLAPGPTATDDAGNDWFDFNAAGTYSTIHNLDGVEVAGVSVQVTGSLGFNTAGENNWVGLDTQGGAAPNEFVDSVTTDLMFNDATITISGLDTGLAYDITTVSHGGGAGLDAVVDIHTITGAATFESSHTRGDARLSGTFHSFPGVVPNGSGEIVLVTSQPSGTNAAFNGLLLEVVEGADVDDDGLPDDWELAQTGVTGLSDLDGTIATTSGSGSGSGDFDGDGLVDAGEYNGGVDSADAGKPDTDGDGLFDVVETRTGSFVSASDTGTSPNLVDTDGDTLSDFDEVNTHGTDPNKKDTDGDELTDADELARGTYAVTADSDGDGSVDGAEVLFGTDPQNASSTPALDQVLAGLVGPGSVGKFFEGTLPLTTPLVSTGDSWTRVTALPSVSFSDAMGLVPEPGTNNLIVYERGGRLQQVDYNAATTTKTQIMDMSSLVNASGLGGLMTMVLHPEYNQGGSPNKDYLYVFYTTSATAGRGFTNADNSLFIRISRFTRDSNTGLVPLNTELVLIQQKFAPVGFGGFVHIAGGMTFGSDGFLYIAWGDNEHAPNNVVPGVPFYQDAQRVDRVFQCSTIAIDVDSEGGAVSTAPIRALQGNTGPNAIAGASQSCPPSHPWYHADNHSGVGYYVPRANYFHGDNYSTVAGTAGTSQGYIYNQHDVSSNRFLVNYNYDAHGDALEEHVAVGLRNSWKMCADPVDGDIAMFEVGSNSNDRSKNFEEFNVIEFGQQGGNYGWPYREGNVLQEYETGVTKGPGGDSGVPVYLGVETDPVFAYSHTTSPGGRSASGGVFYYGTSLSSLPGKLIGGDHDGTIWSVDYKAGGTPVVNHLLESGTSIRQMALSPDGEDILWVSAGQVHRLVDVSATTPAAPATLSATGAFANLATLEPREGMISYEPIAPLWSDRATKPRYMAIPNDMGVDGEYDLADEKITFSENGNWGFPQGTVFVKHFSLPLDEGDPGNPATSYKVETRFLVHGDDGEYYGFTYRWRDDQTNADLIPPGDTSSYATTVLVTREDDSTYLQTWDFPTRTECFSCHQSASGFVLGVRSRQLNGPWDYSATSAANGNVLGAFEGNQLMTLDQLDALDQDITVSEVVDYLTSANISDETATLEHRVFSYIDSNCANCHQPNGAAGRANFDALLTTPFSLKKLVGFPPQAGSLGLIDPEIVKPGDPLNSLLYHRDASVNTDIMMPPLAKTIADVEYLAVLYKWIERIGYENFDANATATGLIGGLFDDDDGDGLVNGLEFYLGTNAGEWTNDPGYSVGNVGGVTQFLIPVNGDAVEDGIAPTVFDSVNLLDWYEAGTPNSILTFGSDTSGVGISGLQTWDVLPGNPKGFFSMGLSN